MASRGTPDWGDLKTPVGNHLVYPRRLLIQILEAAFSEPALYTTGEENPFLFKKNPDGEVAEDSKIVIADTYSDELQQTDPRPIILVARGETGIIDHAIGAQLEPTGWFGASKKYQAMIDSSVSFYCLGRQGLESEELAWVVGLLMKTTKMELKRQMNLFFLGNPRVAPMAAVKSDAQVDLYMTPVHVPVMQTLRYDVKRPIEIAKIVSQFFLKNHTGEKPFLEV